MSWKCPKCGREFSKQGQSHFCEKPKTIDDYILSQDENIRPKLNEVREILRSAIPDAEEQPSCFQNNDDQAHDPRNHS